MVPVRLAVTVLVVVLAGLLLAGCGGDDRLSKQEFVAQGDALCRRINRQIQSMPAPRTSQDLARQSRTLLRSSRRTLDEFRALKAPEELQPVVDDYLDAIAAQNVLVGRLAAAAARNDPREVRKLTLAAQRGNVRSDRLAQRIGFRVCGSDS